MTILLRWFSELGLGPIVMTVLLQWVPDLAFGQPFCDVPIVIIASLNSLSYLWNHLQQS